MPRHHTRADPDIGRQHEPSGLPDAVASVTDASGRDDDPALRPRRLVEFIGQDRPREILDISISSARRRGETMDHCLLYGAPGLGKTTLAQIVATEMEAGFRQASAPSIGRPGDMASILVSLLPGDVLFVDEIHRLAPPVQEMLYTAMEDFRIDIVVGEVGRTQAVQVPLPRFTLVGATTRSGMLSRPFRERFGIDVKLDLYEEHHLDSIVRRSACLLGVELQDADCSREIARRARGTPRVANRLLRRVRDWVQSRGSDVINIASAREALEFHGVDGAGLGEIDRRYLELLRGRFHGRPVGLKTLAATLGEDACTVEEEIEPWLVRMGIIERTARGRMIVQAPSGLLV